MSRPATTKPKSENRLVRYLKDTRAEINKVTWPTREEGLRLTWVVLVVTIISAIALFGIDSLFGSLIGFIIRAT
ncbi:MAG: preprotein translocase subunit SecE [Caldilineaceae bacterium]|nr:preprotein translocase subunit SecE [Caldilineaceae bacterium]